MDRPVIIETERKLKKGSPKSLDIIVDITCDDIHKFGSTSHWKRGGYGDVYKHCIFSKQGIKYCEYVVKIEKCDEDKYRELVVAKNTNNRAYEMGLAPKIYKLIQCEALRTTPKCLTLMDLVEGETLSSQIVNDDLSIYHIDDLFRAIKKLHSGSSLQYTQYHGDLNPANIIYDEGTKKYVFIDFTYRDDYEPIYDYATFLFYLNFYYSNTKKNLPPFGMSLSEVLDYFYKKVFNELEKLKGDFIIDKLLEVRDSNMKDAAKRKKYETIVTTYLY